MNKNLLFVVLVLSLAFAPGVLGASEPVLISSFELDDEDWSSHSGTQLMTASNGVDMFDDNLLVTSVSGDSITNTVDFHVQVYSLGGTVVYEHTSTGSCGGFDPSSPSISPPTYIDGNIMYGGTSQCPGFQVMRGSTFIDYSEAFFPLVRHQGYSAGVGVTAPTAQMHPVFSSGEVLEILSSNGYWKLNSTDSLTFEGAVTGRPDLPSNYGTFLHDVDNNVFWNSQTPAFFSYPADSYDDFIVQTNLGGISGGTGEPVDWNRNPLNPEYITSEGNLVIVGGSNYDNIQTSGFQLDADKYFIFERSNVIGVKNGSFVWADLTNIANITVQDGVTQLNADFITREGNNRIVTYNTTTRIINIYEVPLPDFFDFLEAGVNTPPEQDLEFLGVDISGDFIFKNEMTDSQGGSVFQAQTILLSSQDINDLIIEETIAFDLQSDENYYEDDNIGNGKSIKEGTPSFITPGGDFENYAEYGHTYDGSLTVTLPMGVTASETQEVGALVRYVYHDSITPFQNLITHTISFLDQDDRFLLRLFVERHEDTENITISTLDINGFVDEVILSNYNLSGDGDYYTMLPNFDFVSGNVTLSMATNESIALSEVPIVFTDPTAFGIAKVVFGEEGTDSIAETFYIDVVAVEYLLFEASNPEYNLIDLFTAGETQIFPTAVGGSTGFGEYTLYSYATDSTLGTDNYDTLVTVNFVYDNSTDLVDQNEINNIISGAQDLAGIGDTGFNNLPSFVDGDIITDTLFSSLDGFGIKSPASRFAIAVVIIILAMGFGASYGGMVGSVVGGILGLFLMGFLGFIPLWVTVLVTVITGLLFARSLTGMLNGS